MQQADVIALQEVRHDVMRDSQPKSLALRLKQYPYFVFQPASVLLLVSLLLVEFTNLF
jgi:hypothetical protein